MSARCQCWLCGNRRTGLIALGLVLASASLVVGGLAWLLSAVTS